MADLDDMSLEKFKLWTSNALRVFLSLRKKQICGNFDELAARAFCTWEERIAVDVSAEQKERRLLSEYKTKLCFGEECIPDPLTLSSGWEGEKTGLSKWPSVYITDISKYLNTKNSDDLMNRLLNEYKEGKAYSYFTGEWVKEVFYHDLNVNKCIVKAKVTPSQAVNNRAYDVWLVLQKASNSVPGGEILGGYCTCTAGMLGSCNHIAGVLFRIEHAVKSGQTKIASTSQKCAWNVPKAKTTIKPGKVSDFVWKKSKYSHITNIDKENRNNENRKTFTPFNEKQRKTASAIDTRMKLYETLKEDVPNSSFVLLIEKRRINNEQMNVSTLPKTVKEIADTIDINGKTHEQCVAEFKSKMQITEEQKKDLDSSTTGQGTSATWKAQREGRVTSSIFHRVFSRAKTLRKKPEEDPSSVVNSILGSAQSITTKSMKHGLSLEPYAKRCYRETLKTDHVKFETYEAGIHIYTKHPYLAASPDLYVTCKCCGEGLCEVKCPESIKEQIPTPKNVPYITLINDKVTLKRQHPYFFQVQGQMGITGRKYCDFFIFTCHGHICTRVEFDALFFEEMILNLVWFWETFVTRRLLLCKNVLSEKNKEQNQD